MIWTDINFFEKIILRIIFIDGTYPAFWISRWTHETDRTGGVFFVLILPNISIPKSSHNYLTSVAVIDHGGTDT